MYNPFSMTLERLSDGAIGLTRYAVERADAARIKALRMAFEAGRLQVLTHSGPTYFDTNPLGEMRRWSLEKFNIPSDAIPAVSLPVIMREGERNKPKVVRAAKGFSDTLDAYSMRFWGMLYPGVLIHCEGAADGSVGNERIVLEVFGGLEDSLGPSSINKRNNSEGWVTQSPTHISFDLRQTGQVEISAPGDKVPKMVSPAYLAVSDIAEYFIARVMRYSNGLVGLRRSHVVQGLNMLIAKAPDFEGNWEQVELNNRFKELLSKNPELVMSVIRRSIQLNDEQKEEFDNVYARLKSSGEDRISDLDGFWGAMSEVGYVKPQGQLLAIYNADLSASSFEMYDNNSTDDLSEARIPFLISGGYGLQHVVGICDGLLSKKGRKIVQEMVKQAVDARDIRLEATRDVIKSRVKTTKQFKDSLNKGLENRQAQAATDRLADNAARHTQRGTLGSLAGRLLADDEFGEIEPKRRLSPPSDK